MDPHHHTDLTSITDQSLSRQPSPKPTSPPQIPNLNLTPNPNRNPKLSSMSIQPQQLIKQLQIKRELSEIQISQLMYLMFYILNYPALGEAYTHALANRMGLYDVKKDKEKEKEKESLGASGSSNAGGGKNKEYCKCCGYAKQEQVIPICTGFDNFPSIGMSTYLFFQTIKNLILLLLLAFLIHGLYSLITNLYTAKVFTPASTSSISLSQLQINSLISWISLDSKVTASNIGDGQSELNVLYMVEMWIGVGLVVLWSLFLYLIRYYERKYEVMVDKETITAADFSIIIENYPRNLTKQQLQAQLDAYAQKLECPNPSIFQIEKISLNTDPTILLKSQQQQMQQLNTKYHEMLQIFADWVCMLQEEGELPYSSEKRGEIYQKFQKIKGKRLRQGKKIMETMLMQARRAMGHINGAGDRDRDSGDEDEGTDGNNEEFMSNSNHSTNPHPDTSHPDINTPQAPKQGKTIAVITFKHSNSKDLISKHNTMDFAKTIRHFLRCCPAKSKLILTDEHNVPREIKIEKAPEPEDIKWENLSISVGEKMLRKAGTYLVTLVLLSMSFALVYFLSVYETNNKSDAYLNFSISFIISLINFFIGFLIRFLTIFEKDYTETGYQTSLAIKSIWAQLLNSIVVPLIVNYIIEQKNIFGQNGLSNDIIYLAITNSFLPPLTKLIDPYHKYTLIRAYYIRSSLKERLLMRQIELNQSQEYMEFETGYQYIYFINLYLFTSFYVTLQPVISIFAIAGMFFMYWIQKYAVLNRMRRPVPGTDLVNSAMSQMINLGPVFFAIGALSWSHLLDGYRVEEGARLYYVPNIVTAGLAALFFVFPFNVIFDKCLPNLELENLDYGECRVLLNSEYDRTNPVTMEKAIKEYEQYLENLMEQEEIQETKEKEEEKQVKQKQKKKGIKFATIHLGDDQSLNDDQQTSKKNKSKNNINTTVSIGTTVKNIGVDKSYLTRKKQVLRARTRVKTKNDPVHSIIQEMIDNEIENKGYHEQQGDKGDGNQLRPKSIFNMETHILKSKEKERTQMEYIEEENEENENDQGVKKIRIRNPREVEKNKERNVQFRNNPQPQQKPRQQPKIKKYGQQKPKKVHLDFRPFLPLQNTDTFFQTSPQNSRNDNYMNFFGKKFSMGSELAGTSKQSQLKNQRRENNPYEKAFK